MNLNDAPIIAPPSQNKLEEEMLAEIKKNKMAIPLGGMLNNAEAQMCFQRMLDKGYIRLIDIQPAKVDATQIAMCRVFMVTNAGDDRRRELENRRKIAERLKNQ